MTQIRRIASVVSNLKNKYKNALKQKIVIKPNKANVELVLVSLRRTNSSEKQQAGGGGG